ncbi:MAG: hypothetical protein M3220_10180 [Chloroflexota bacterium]|nr:hypothetical protein [Chloroflexota bacterium]
MNINVIERIEDTPSLATLTDTSTLQSQLDFLEAWRKREWERAQLTTGAIRTGCLAQLNRLDKEIARNKRFLAKRGV